MHVALEGLGGWFEVTDRLDAEPSLCLRLAELGFAREVAELDRWALVMRVPAGLGWPAARRRLRYAPASGGLRNAQAAWLQLMAAASSQRTAICSGDVEH